MAAQSESIKGSFQADRGDKVVMRLLSGRTLKGTLTDFSPTSPRVKLDLSDKKDRMEVSLNEVKAIFFVKTFTGNKDYHEKRKFGLAPGKGRRIMVRFKDGEILLGLSDAVIPKEGGSLAALAEGEEKGIVLYPADPDSNNMEVFVVLSSLIDIRYL
jgi:small nuclear ribonucleoprotein (snRNP)-like protein